MKAETVWIVTSTETGIIYGVYRAYRDAHDQVRLRKNEGLTILQRKVL